MDVDVSVAGELRRDFDRILSKQFEATHFIVRDRLMWLSKIIFGMRNDGFPKLKYLNSHLDIVSSYGIEISKALKTTYCETELFSRILVEAVVLKKKFIFRPTGLFVFKTRDNVPICDERVEATPIQYITFGTNVLNEMLKVGLKEGC